MRKKQLICAILVLAMLIGVTPAYAAVQEDSADTQAAVTTVIMDEDDTTEPDPEPSEETEPEPSEEPDPEPSEDPEPETPEEPDPETPEEPTTYTVTFILGESQITIEVEAEDGEDTVIPAESVPTEDEDGNAVIRWYSSDLSAVVEPSELTLTGDITLVAWFAPTLISDHSAYMGGYSDGSFGPNNSLTRAQVAQILYNLLVDTSAGSFPCTYSDVSSDAWYYTAVTTVASLGLLDCDGGEFGPDEAITRAEFVAIVTRLVNSVEAENPFNDVSESDPYYEAIMTAYALGWVTGMTEDTFSPDTGLTRAQAVTIFNRILGRSADTSVIASGEGLRSFTDVSTGSWFYAAIMEATIDHEADTTGEAEVWTSYTHSYTVTFLVDGNATTMYVYPGETAGSSGIPTTNASGKSIARWVITGTNTMADPYITEVTANVSYTAWYSPSLVTSHVVYINGYSDGTFRPDNSLTRAEACQMLYSLLSSQSRGSYATTFADVASDSWYYEAITTLASLNIITATGGNYYPDETISRGEFVEMISRLTTLSHSSNSFTDVDESNPYYYAISTVSAKGWVNGMGDGTFSPDSALTRAQAVTIFNRIMNRYGDSSAENAMDSRYTFSDLSSSHWAFVAVMEAATSHTYTGSGKSETWTSYTHTSTGTVNWESSDSVVNAATIILSYSSTYSGNYTHSYNVDYSNTAKENYVNSKGYSSSTGYLIWVSRACQKVYIFTALRATGS
ncbi:MAG: S-layer homology domain-containing protein [Oscillospiraceae bacterium]|nr:S-layer homology domain-containing protein [Oscillospiraceae bacterium]